MQRRGCLPLKAARPKDFEPARRSEARRVAKRPAARPAVTLVKALGDLECPPDTAPEPALLGEIRSAFGHSVKRMSWETGASSRESTAWKSWETGARAMPRPQRLVLHRLLGDLAERQAYERRALL